MISRIRIAGGVLSAALAGTALTTLPAGATDSYEGRAIASGGLTVRALPTTASKAKGSIAKGHVFPIVCKVKGTSVEGNNLWYALPPTLGEWVSARYVQNVGSAPRWCGNSERFVGRTTTAVKKRVAPTTAATSAGTLAKGAGLDIICKLDGQNIDGNKRWYYLTDGRWVAARYVTNVGRAPGWCN
jgi:hypothetical protein